MLAENGAGMKKFLLAVSFVFILAGFLFTSGCTTKIGNILENFQTYEGREVTIRGTVGENIWLAFFERGAFEIGDSSGKIWVVTSQPPPERGSKVTVTGTAQAAFTLGDRSLGKVVIQKQQ